jgi:hypothetical protein
MLGLFLTLLIVIIVLFLSINELKKPKLYEMKAETNLRGDLNIYRWTGECQEEILTGRVAYLNGGLIYKNGDKFELLPESYPLLEKYLGIKQIVTPEKILPREVKYKKVKNKK